MLLEAVKDRLDLLKLVYSAVGTYNASVSDRIVTSFTKSIPALPIVIDPKMIEIVVLGEVISSFCLC